jgi:hypothetical protein
MLGGPADLAFISFALVKFAGYTCAAWVLNRSFQTRQTNVWKVGAARTALGLAAGAAYGALYIWLASDKGSYFAYFAGLLPIRLGEWSLVIWYFYQRERPDHVLLLRNSVFGILSSYVLDAIGIFATFVVPGGRWIC